MLVHVLHEGVEGHAVQWNPFETMYAILCAWLSVHRPIGGRGDKFKKIIRIHIGWSCYCHLMLLMLLLLLLLFCLLRDGITVGWIRSFIKISYFVKRQHICPFSHEKFRHVRIIYKYFFQYFFSYTHNFFFLSFFSFYIFLYDAMWRRWITT